MTITSTKTENLTKSIITSARPYFDQESIAKILSDVENILESGILILGPYAQKFEESFAKYTGTKYALAVSSCSAALEISMRFFELKNSEVIVPTNTFIATPNSVIFAGGKPVFADITPGTYNISSTTVMDKFTQNTKGVIAVHLGGLPILDINNIQEFCKEKDLFFIEDSSHAHGASIDGKKVGSIGDVGCFSLMATKVITSGLGGMITTDNQELYEYASTVRNSASGRFTEINYFASNWMMSEITAAIGLQQLEHLDEFLKTRNKIAEKYMKGLEDINKISFFKPPSNVNHAYYKFLATLDKNIDKKNLIAKAKNEGIQLGSLYEIPCHLQSTYQKLGYTMGECPVAEEGLLHQISLPMHVQLTDEDVERVVSFLKEEIK